MKRFVACIGVLLAVMLSANAQTYVNPILGGDYPDPTIMREGKDYYMTHSAFDYQPGLTVWHSRDLVNWEPISYALKTYLGSVWAPDICKYKDRYYIYFTVASRPRSNYVVWAKSPYGPWSDPINLTEEVVYKGWPIPEDWITEGMALEGPKLRKIGKYFYYMNAEGGTAGPPTSHMVVQARSESINGPWVDAPNNPLIHTWSNDERWWSKGHGSIIDTPDGQWVIVYHSYENGFTNLGRQTLMEPIYLGKDGWFHRYDSIDVAKPIRAQWLRVNDSRFTVNGPLDQRSLARQERSKRLSEFRLGLEWKFYKAFNPERVKVADGVLTLQAQGTDPGTSAPLMFVAGAHRYQIEAEIELQGDVTAGLVLYYNSQFYQGTGFDHEKRYRYRKGGATRSGVHAQKTTRLWLRLQNYDSIVTGWWSVDGKNWKRETWGMDCSGYNHNTLYEFQSVLPGVFAAGNGQAVFRNFKYTSE